MADLNNAWTAASEEMYKAQAASGAGEQAGPNGGGGAQSSAGGNGGETVTDAEFEEVK